MSDLVRLDRLGGEQITVRGYGGSKGKQKQQSARAGNEESDVSLRSKAYMEVIALLGEGEFQGFNADNPLKAIYLDETPIMNADGSLNFQDVQVDYRLGTQTQDYIPTKAGGVSTIQPISVKVDNASPAVRTINNPSANAAVIRVMTPILRKVDKEGKLVAAKVEYKIEVSTQGASYVQVVSDKFNGYTTGPVERDHRIPLTTVGPWNIRVTRVSEDSTSTQLSNDLYWQAINVIIDKKFRYPNSVLLKLRISAEQFRSFPRLAVYALMQKVRVPHNYNPATRVYTGTFNGTLTAPQWTDNPAWIFYDLATNSRYGAGKYITPELMDVFTLYTIGQYCDQLVPDGYGAMEPRFTCNIYLQESGEAHEVLSAIASIFRGMVYCAQGTVFASQDAPKLPVRIYTEANVIQEVDQETGEITKPPFNYPGAGIDAIHTAAYVTYSDPNDFFRSAIEYVEDPDGISRYGFNPVDRVAVGCTSRGQARRCGLWLLMTERLRNSTINFSVGSDGLLVRPGELFKVADPMRSGSRMGGRIINANVFQVNLDNPITIQAGLTYTITVIAVNGTAIKATVVNTPGTYPYVGLTAPLPEVPLPGTPYIIESSAVQAQLFTAVKVSEVEDHIYEITGLAYNESIYNAVDNGTLFESIPTSGLPNPSELPVAPTALIIEESVIEAPVANGTRSALIISWKESTSTFIRGYEVEYRRLTEVIWGRIGETSSNMMTLYDVPQAIYEFRVRAVNHLGTRGNWSDVTTSEVFGLNAVPKDIEGFVINVVGDTLRLSWDLAPDIDVRIGGYILVRYSPAFGSIDWSQADDAAYFPGVATSGTLPLRDGTYLIKAIDSSWRQSGLARSVQVNNTAQVLELNAYELFDDVPTGWNGAKYQVSYRSGGLTLNTTDYVDTFTGNWDSLTSAWVDQLGQPVTVYPYGEYWFNKIVDLGVVATARVTAKISVLLVNETDAWDSRAGDLDSFLGNIDGTNDINASAELQVSTSNDGVTYSTFSPVVVADITARYFIARIVLRSGNINHNIRVTAAQVLVDMADRLDSGALTTVAGATVVNLNQPFVTAPYVGVTLQNGFSGDYVSISSITKTFFVVTCFNSANSPISRTIVWFAKGY